MKTFNLFGISALALCLTLLSVPLSPVVAYAASDRSNNSARNETSSPSTKKELPTQSQASEHSAQHQVETIVQTAPTTTTEQSSNSPVTNSVATTSLASQTTPKQDPAGNNGTVKIDSAPFDSHPDNQPHVTCTFQVDFYGFDANVGDAEVIFELQSPTRVGRTLSVISGDLTPNIGQDAAGGGTDLDASETYTLGFTGAPHSKQGYHVKLTVHAPGSQGSDVKHKVFWVQPCVIPVVPHTPNTPQTPGVISGASASIVKPQTTQGNVLGLPASLPSTGANTSKLLIGFILAIATYIVVYRIDTKKKLFS